MSLNFVHHPELKTRGPVGWKGTPLDEKGRFVNLNFPFWPEFSQLVKWQTQKNPFKEEKKKDLWRPEQVVPQLPASSEDGIIWLGHASFFIRLAGTNILIDPVFGSASVVKRKIPPLIPEFLSGNVDWLLVSHDHRDHCDPPSLKWMKANNPSVRLFTGLQMKPWLSEIFPSSEIREAGWYQVFQPSPYLEFWFLPNRHWSRRSLNDTNKRLWGGFLIRTQNKVVYFMGDSGYDDHFQHIGALFPDIDLAIMGIGAYFPEWFMHPSHMAPEESWKAFCELGAQRFLPMHYGTFDLADEPLSEPIRRIRSIARPEVLVVPPIGQFTPL